MFWMLTLVAQAQTGPEKQVLDQLSKKYAPVEVMQGTFTQTTKSAYGDQTSQGTVVLQRPGKMRWEFGDGRQFVSDGATLWIYDPSAKQVMKIGNFGQQAATAEAVLTQMHTLGEHFTVSLSGGDAAAGWDLTLVPKEEGSAFTKLVLELEPDLDLDRVRITDAFQAETLLDFTKLDLGGAVDAAVFTFQVPPGVKVIEG
jgi:chaperone LolA